MISAKGCAVWPNIWHNAAERGLWCLAPQTDQRMAQLRGARIVNFQGVNIGLGQEKRGLIALHNVGGPVVQGHKCRGVTSGMGVQQRGV